MREALARSDHDFVMAEPRSRKAPRRRGFFSALVAILRVILRLAAYPNRILGGLVFGLAIAILVNALMLQHSRHPAPLFHRTVTLPASGSSAPAGEALQAPGQRAPQASAQEPARASAQAPVQVSPQASAQGSPQASARESVQGPAPAEAARHSAAPTEPTKLEPDPIGQLLKSEPAAAPKGNAEQEKKPAPHRHMREAPAVSAAKPAAHDPITHLLDSSASKEAPGEAQPKTVLAVQKALVRLGFVVRPDGQMGAVTRHAIEQYERDHGLPIEARLTPKLLRRLAAETGVAID